MLKRDFGSFHVSNVQELISLPEETYRPPVTPFDLPKFVYDSAKDSTRFIYGSDAQERHFLLEETCTFLNHGAFGAVLKDALQTAQKWQSYIERQPLRFYDRELMPHLVHITRRLAKFVGCDAEDLVLMPNVTTAMNCILHSFKLGPGENVLHFSIEYGAVKEIINEICASKGATRKEVFLSMPLSDKSQIMQCLAAGLDDKTRLVVVDHIPSNTPFIMPIRDIVDLCHEKNIPVLVDGAHALGQLDLDLRSLNADFYVTNCHKWFCSPKGAALMYVAKQHKSFIRPLVISHGFGSGFNSEFIWAGLKDYSSYLSLHTVLDFWLGVGPENIRQHIHSLAQNVGKMLTDRWQTDLLAPKDLTGSMLCVRLPSKLYKDCAEVTYAEAETVQNILYHNFHIEVPIKAVQGHLYVRISAHIYNTMEQYQKLAEAILTISEKVIFNDPTD